MNVQEIETEHEEQVLRFYNKMNLETLTGPLAESFKNVDPNTISSSAEIMKERQINEQLTEKIFWTRQSAIYTVEDGEVMLYLTDKVDDNLIFQNIDEATRQLIRYGRYVPEDNESVERIVGSLEGVKLSELDLSVEGNQFSYFEIDTLDYDSLNPSQRFLAEKIYGTGDDFKASMKMLCDKGIEDTRVYLMNVKADTVGTIVWACKLNDIDNDFLFSACGEEVDDEYVGLRGIPVEAEDNYLNAYQTLVESPEKMTPDIAAGLLELVNTHIIALKE